MKYSWIHLHKRGTCPKLSDKFAGPYTVLAQISEVNYIVKDEVTGKQQTVHVNRMKLIPEKDTMEKVCNKQVELSEEQYEEMFGNSGSETFHGFEDENTSEEEEETTYTVYHITSAAFETNHFSTQEGCLNNGDDP